MLLYSYNMPCKYCKDRMAPIRDAIREATSDDKLPFTVVYSNLSIPKADQEATRKTLKDAGIPLRKIKE